MVSRPLIRAYFLGGVLVAAGDHLTEAAHLHNQHLEHWFLIRPKEWKSKWESECSTCVTCGRGCRGDAFQGVWGQPTWLHMWMTVRPWAMCLLGAFCSGRAAVLKSTGTSDAYKEGRPFIKLCLISVRLRILPCSLNLQCQLMSNWPLSNLITDYSLTVNTCARCKCNESMTLGDIAS